MYNFFQSMESIRLSHAYSKLTGVIPRSELFQFCIIALYMLYPTASNTYSIIIFCIFFVVIVSKAFDISLATPRSISFTAFVLLSDMILAYIPDLFKFNELIIPNSLWIRFTTKTHFIKLVNNFLQNIFWS